MCYRFYYQLYIERNKINMEISFYQYKGFELPEVSVVEQKLFGRTVSVTGTKILKGGGAT